MSLLNSLNTLEGILALSAAPTTVSIPLAQPPTAASRPHVGLTVGLAVLGIFVTYLPIGGVAVSLSTISQATGAGTSDLQWVAVAYTIPMAAVVLSAGVFGDLHGRRRVYSLGMLLTVIGAVVAGLSNLAGGVAVPLLWAGQALSGLGAGVLLPTTLALISYVEPNPKARGRYVGMWATGMALGLALGPIISGGLLQFASWGWIFAPIGALALIAGLVAHAKLPESKHATTRLHLDWPGQVTASVAIAATIFGVIEGGSRGWNSLEAILGLAVGGAAIIAFLLAESRSTAPLLNLELFRSPAFSAAGFAALVALFSVVGTIFLLSLFFGSVQHLNALEIGVRLLFVSGVATIANQFTGRLLHVIKPLWVLAAGLVLSGVAILLLNGIDESTSFVAIAWRLAIFGISFSLMLTPMSIVAINSVSWERAGMASAANTMLRQCGSALGPAVLGSILSSRLGTGEDFSSALHPALVTTTALLAVAAVGCIIAAILGRRAATA